MVKLNELEKLMCDLFGVNNASTREKALFLLGISLGTQATAHMIQNNITFEGYPSSFNHCKQIAELTKSGKVAKKSWDKLQEIMRG